MAGVNGSITFFTCLTVSQLSGFACIGSSDELCVIGDTPYSERNSTKYIPTKPCADTQTPSWPESIADTYTDNGTNILISHSNKAPNATEQRIPATVHTYYHGYPRIPLKLVTSHKRN